MPDLAIQVSQLRDKDGHGHNRDGALIELDGFGVAALVAAQFAQPGQRAIIARVDVQRGNIGAVRGCNIARLRLVFAQLKVEPGEVFRGQAGFCPGRDRALHQADRPRRIAGDKF